MPIDWAEARTTAWRVGYEARPEPVTASFEAALGSSLASPLTAASDLPAFPTSAVDAWAVCGEGPWTITGAPVLAGTVPPPLAPGTAVEIATGAQVPARTTGLIRIERASVDGDRVTGPAGTEWREPGEEAAAGEELLPAGAEVTPPVLGLAAAAGRSSLKVYPKPRAALVVFGDELLTSGPSHGGRVRDALGPMVPHLLAAAGSNAPEPIGPVADTLDEHVRVLRESLETADLVCTTGGTMAGPVDHLHSALEAIGADCIVNTVAVRPGFPMLLARTGEGRFIAGLPGNPQSAVIALISLVVPLLAGLRGLPLPEADGITVAQDIPGRGEFTHLSLVDRSGRRLAHHGSAMLRGLAGAAGFALIAPGGEAKAGQTVPLVPIPGVST